MNKSSLINIRSKMDNINSHVKCISLKYIFTFSGRSYGYGKQKIKKDVVPIPPKKLPLCSGGCTRQLISPECREETFGFENGMECRGCPVDICKGQLPIGGGNIGLDRSQDNRNWQNGGNWGNGDFINQRRNGGFIDSFQNLDFLNQGQGNLFNNRLRNGLNRNRLQNQQFGNQWQ